MAAGTIQWASRRGKGGCVLPTARPAQWGSTWWCRWMGQQVMICLIGTVVGPAAPPPAPKAAPPTPPMRMLIGANGFANLGMDNVSAVVGTLREYQDWDWTEHTQDENAFQPCDDNYFFLDWFYGNLTAVGVEPHVCVQKSAAYIHGGNSSEANWKPLTAAQLATPGAAMQPASYARVSDHFFQYAARYGRIAVPANQLKLQTGQPVLSGSGLLKWLELFNEPNGWWSGRNAFFAGYEYAAMLSAAVDGHCGSMGAGYGAKTADPTMKIAAAGLATSGTDYIETMRLWFAKYRADGAFPADAINFHVYANDAAQHNGTSTVGISPEDFGLAPLLSGLCAYRDTWLPGTELWLTEYGYDVTAPSPQRAPAIGPNSAETVQAQWLLRSVLAIASTRCIQRAHMYMLADVTTGSGGLYATSGLLTSPGFSAKPSYYYFATAMRWLGNSFFSGSFTVPGAGYSGLVGACFKDTLTGTISAVVWSPTSNATSVSAVPLPVGAGAACPITSCSSGSGIVNYVLPTAGIMNGTVTQLTCTGGSITLPTVSETPVFLQ